jgi:hypothetical protein
MKPFFLALGLCGWVYAAPLMTSEYPLWVQDAVLALKQRGLLSAGCLPQEAVTRKEMTPVLENWLRLQSQETEPFVRRDDLAEVKLLLEGLLEQGSHLQQRTQSVKSSLERHPPAAPNDNPKDQDHK